MFSLILKIPVHNVWIYENIIRISSYKYKLIVKNKQLIKWGLVEYKKMTTLNG